MARKPVQTRAEVMAEKRAELLETARVAFSKLKRGKAITEREARILKKCHDSFLELYEVFKPTLRDTLRDQGALIYSLLEQDDDEEEDDEEDDED